MDVTPPHRIINGPMTYTPFWAEVKLHPGDVVVATVPKSGTTWTQALVSALLSGTPGAPYMIEGQSAWVDCSLRPVTPLAEVLKRTPGRRCLKSHAPIDALPWSDELFYIATYRHPLDAHFSMRTHLARMPERIALSDRYPEDDPDRTYALFLDEDKEGVGADNMSLEGIAAHLDSFAAVAERKNVLLLHYADLQRDPMRIAAEIAAFLAVDVSPKLLAEIVDAAGFEKMRARAAATPNETFSATPAFFAEATSGKWAGRLTVAQLEAYTARAATLMSPMRQHWLENGGRFTPGDDPLA